MSICFDKLNFNTFLAHCQDIKSVLTIKFKNFKDVGIVSFAIETKI